MRSRKDYRGHYFIHLSTSNINRQTTAAWTTKHSCIWALHSHFLHHVHWNNVVKGDNIVKTEFPGLAIRIDKADRPELRFATEVRIHYPPLRRQFFPTSVFFKYLKSYRYSFKNVPTPPHHTPAPSFSLDSFFICFFTLVKSPSIGNTESSVKILWASEIKRSTSLWVKTWSYV